MNRELLLETRDVFVAGLQESAGELNRIERQILYISKALDCIEEELYWNGFIFFCNNGRFQE